MSRIAAYYGMVFTLFVYLASPVQAHIRMSKPPAMRSEDHPAYAWGREPAVDYNIAGPLLSPSDYPCKGYHVDIPSFTQATETVQAGQQFSITLSNNNGTDHEGGSCQVALSYDGGASFGVIHSWIGGCPTAPNDRDTDTLSFTFPEETPAGNNVLLSWTWITKTGLMEMYQNCAAINIQSSSSSMTVPAVVKASLGAKSAVCQVVYDNELVFSNPGKYVTYGGTWAGQTPGPIESQTRGCTQEDLGMGSVTLQSNGETVASSAGGDASQANSGSQAVPSTTGYDSPPIIPTDKKPQVITEPSATAEQVANQATQTVPSGSNDTGNDSPPAPDTSAPYSAVTQPKGSTDSESYPVVGGGGKDCKGKKNRKGGKYGRKGSANGRHRYERLI